MDNGKEQEAERRRIARTELASRLHTALGFALAADLTTEAAIVARLIEATIGNTTLDLYIKLTKKPDA